MVRAAGMITHKRVSAIGPIMPAWSFRSSSMRVALTSRRRRGGILGSAQTVAQVLIANTTEPVE